MARDFSIVHGCWAVEHRLEDMREATHLVLLAAKVGDALAHELAMILELQITPDLVCEHVRVLILPLLRLNALVAIRGSTSAGVEGCVTSIVGIDLESAC